MVLASQILTGQFGASMGFFGFVWFAFCFVLFVAACFGVFVYLLVSLVMKVDPRISCMLGRHSVTEFYPSPRSICLTKM